MKNAIRKPRGDKTATDFILRNIPAELHRKIKVRAAEEGTTMREWILDALDRVLREGREP